MNQVPENFNVLTSGSETGNHSSFGSRSVKNNPGERLNSMKPQFLLGDEELERIKNRIRKKHHNNTTKLLILYGILLIIFISCFSYYEILG